MKTLVAKNILLLAVGGAGAVVASGCGSSIDDCTMTRTCAIVAGAGGSAGAGKGGSAGTAAMAGKSGAGSGDGATGGIGEGEGTAGAGGDGDPNSEDAGTGGAASGGCIDEKGQAQSGTTETACGADGKACAACAAGLVCKAGSCVCTPDSCADGCCSKDGKCESAAAAHCGTAGAECVECGDGLSCDEKTGKCVCDATSCPDGCCSSDGECLRETNAHCGPVGGSCGSCDDGQRCNAGTGICVCDATSCPTGCCDGDGRCVGDASESNTQCGAGGGACTACSAGQACSASGTCVCTPESCDGWCYGDTCEPFEKLATNQPTFPATRGIALRNSEIYWTSSSSSDAAADKYRLQRIAGSGVETLVSNQAHTLGPVLIGAERLFVLNTDTGFLESMKPTDNLLSSDQANVAGLRYRSGRIYWSTSVVNRFKELHIKSQNETDSSDVVDEFSTVIDSAAEVGDIAFASGLVAYGVNMPGTSGAAGSYGIWLATPDHPQVFPARSGHLEQVECDADSNYYWRASASASSGASLMMENDGASGPTAIAPNLDITDFTLVQPATGAALVYYAYTDSGRQTSGFRLYDTASSKTYDVVTGPRVGSLTADKTYLYFFEETGHRLVRTPLPHVVFGLGK